MTRLEKLYDIASYKGISFFNFSMPLCSSVSVKQGERCYIAIDASKLATTEEKAVTVAHELGHCATNSFYTPCDSERTRKRCEKRADEWAIRMLVPFSAFTRAYQNGCREAWEFADELGVTCSFAEKAMLYYREKIGRVAAE